MAMKSEFLRLTLLRLYRQGMTARPTIDRLIGQGESDINGDLERLFELSGMAELRKLELAIEEGRLIPRVYWNEHSSSGCLAGILLGFRCTRDCVDYPYPDDAALLSVNRVIRAFDYYELEPAQIGRVLAKFLQAKCDVEKARAVAEPQSRELALV